MPIFIFIGWLVGVMLGAVLGIFMLLGLGLGVPAFLSSLAGLAPPLGPTALVLLGLVIAVLAYLAGYAIATGAIAPLLPGLTGGPVVFPATASFPTPTAAPVTVPATNGEMFGRGLMIGLSAALNFLALAWIPLAGLILGTWAFLLISLGAILFIARSRFYQGFLGWSAWLFPVSYLATAVGLLLFIVNIPFAFAAFGTGAFRIDFTTGVIETAGGLSGITGFTGGFSLGNFTFLTALPAAGSFTVPSLSSHETGHSLNTALMGGVVL